jgi:dimethylargininase
VTRTRKRQLFRYATVRPPGDNFAQGLTSSWLGAPDFAVASAQHHDYCAALEACGLELLRLPPDLEHPDSTFVEDTAVLTERLAILARPGAISRLQEVAGVKDCIQRHYSIVREIEPPGTLDGGDICDAGLHFFIGLSHRTNEAGARQLCQFLSADGYTSSTVDIRGVSSILHLKSGIAHLENRDLVVMEELAGRDEFAGYNLIRVMPKESYACNCVLVNRHVLVPAGFPYVAGELERRGYKTIELEMSEFRKMDGGLSCLSLRF